VIGNIFFGVVISLFIYPLYNSFAWVMYEKVGSDQMMQTYYREQQIARGGFLLILWYSIIMLFFLFYFEDDIIDYFIWTAVAIIASCAYGFGFHSVNLLA